MVSFVVLRDVWCVGMDVSVIDGGGGEVAVGGLWCGIYSLCFGWLGW